MMGGPAAAHGLVEALVAAGGGSVRAVIVFGSQLVRAFPDAHSAWDLVVVVDDYRRFHGHLVRAGHHGRPAWLLSAMARILPPNITAFDPGRGRPLAKCAIVSEAHFARALGPRAPDHFLKGRMVQKVALLWSVDEGVGRWAEAALEAARNDVLNWAGPHLARGGSPFTAEAFARGMLRVSYRGELRPERGDRVEQVFEAQRDFLVATYRRVLDEAVAQGRLSDAGDGGYRFVEPPSRMHRWAVALYFTRSKVRATLRWPKHVVTFNDWLTYIQRKVERRTGLTVSITPWERRLPLLLLWPKVIRVLRHRNDGPDAGPEEPSVPEESR